MPIAEPYLFFDGNCAEAMRFYERALGGKLEHMSTAGEAPGGAQSPEMASRIMHARLQLGDGAVMASDWMAPTPYEGIHGFSVSLNYAQVEEGRRVFEALAAGGRVDLPFQKTFWAEGFGMLVDRFGVPWMVNVSAPGA